MDQLGRYKKQSSMAPGLNPVLNGWNIKRYEACWERSYNGTGIWEMICLFLAKYFNILTTNNNLCSSYQLCV